MDAVPLLPPMPLGVCPSIHMIGIGRMPVPGVRRWDLKDYWALHLYCYEAVLTINGVAVPVFPGTIGLTPPHASMIWTGPESPSEHFYCLFRFPKKWVGGGGGSFAFPAVLRAGTGFGRFWEDVLVAMQSAAREPQRAEVRLWDVLWRLKELATVGEERPLRAAVREACRIIDTDLHMVLRVQALAGRVGVSHNHLTRMFREGLGQTVAGYIRHRRVEQARALLRHTDFPIRTVAAMVGIPDLHLFNKTLRRETGLAPTVLRRRLRSGGE